MPGLKHSTEDATFRLMGERGRGAFFVHRSQTVRVGGAQRSENVGMSNHKTGEIPVGRKPQVSWAMTINPGLGGP